jgi:hypothetical protein
MGFYDEEPEDINVLRREIVIYTEVRYIGVSLNIFSQIIDS